MGDFEPFWRYIRLGRICACGEKGAVSGWGGTGWISEFHWNTSFFNQVLFKALIATKIKAGSGRPKDILIMYRKTMEETET
jgi:hypothetical protein